MGASPFDQKAFDQVKTQNMRGLPEGIPVFYARGAYDEKRMSLKDRTLCRMLKKTLTGKESIPAGTLAAGTAGSRG